MVVISMATILIVSCSCSRLHLTKERAGDNWKELEKVLSRYEQDGDPQKKQAAYFLLENIPYHSYLYSEEMEEAKVWFRFLREKPVEELEKVRDSLYEHINVNAPRRVMWDVQELDSAYLCENLDLAFKVWKEQPWGKNVNFDIFCNYILPYRIDDEVPVNWRREYYDTYNPLLDEFRNSGKYDAEDPVEALKYLLVKLPVYIPKYSTFTFSTFPHIGPDYVKYVSGTCREFSDFVIYVCRALGIPCAFNQTFNMHRVNVAHHWANFWNKYGEEYIISNYPPVLVPNRQDYTLATAKHKVYRETYSVNVSLLEKAKRSGGSINRFFALPTYEDVTPTYTNKILPELRIEADCLKKKIRGREPVYLCSSCRTNWQPEDYAIIDNGQLVFDNVQKGEVYCLCIRLEENYIPVSEPFEIEANTNDFHYFANNGQKETVVLKSKFSVTDEEKSFRDRMRNAVVEGFANEDFSSPDTLFIIQNAPDRKITKVIPYGPKHKKYKYLRYKGIAGAYCDVAEVVYYDAKGERIVYDNVSGTEGIDGGHICSNVYDGSTLTSFSSFDPEGGWSMIELRNDSEISVIEYSPRNRDNFINSGDLYELLYYDGKWNSLGVKTADADTIIFGGVPDGCLLILKNLSGGVQERIFTYENGEQVWR